jgi:hypothetical protein
MGYSITDLDPGAMGIYSGGSWKRITGFGIFSASQWYRIRRIWIWDNTNLLWNRISWFPRVVNIIINTNQVDFDLYNVIETQLGGSIDKPLDINLTVNSGVYLYSTTTSHGALYASSTFPAGTICNLTNAGYIYGCNGDGGNGEDSFTQHGTAVVATAGEDGGPSIEAGCQFSINNGSGYIFGGGGGGGGGGAGEYYGFESFGVPGSGGGGGASRGNKGILYETLDRMAEGNNGNVSGTNRYYLAGTGGASVTVAYGGDWATGGKGGDCLGAGLAGTAGANGNHKSGSGHVGQGKAGGALGTAIDKNGHTVSFTSGDTASRVKGAVIA